MLLDATSRNFDQLAESIATEFISNPSDSINSLIAAAANKDKLNPIEIQRLVEKTNTLVALKMLQISKDKNIEFVLSDYDDVMSMVYDQKEDEPVKEASSSTSGTIPASLPNTRMVSRVSDIELHKVAEEIKPEKDLRVRTAFITKKGHEELLREKVATELFLQDTADWLVAEFSKMRGPDFPKFASEVLAVTGNTAKPLLAGLAVALKEDTEFEKIGGLIDNTTLIHEKFSAAQNSLLRLVELNQKLAESQEQVTKAWEALTK